MLGAAIVIGALGIIAYAISVSSFNSEPEFVDSTTGNEIPNSPTGIFDDVTKGGYVDVLSNNDVLSAAATLIKGFEGYSAIPYPDPPGSNKLSIGYGHQIKPSENLKQVTEEQAYTMLVNDINAAWNCVRTNCNADLTINQAAALTSLCFNIGCTAFKASTLLKDLNNNNFNYAAEQFGAWIYSGGQISNTLIARRQTEKDLFEA